MAVPGINYVKLLNRCMPVAYQIMLGDLLQSEITQGNQLRNRLASATLTAAGLVIKAGASPLAKAGSAFVASANGVLVRKPANTDMAALVGTLATAKSAAWAFYIDQAGALTSSAKTADSASHDAALAALPAPPAGLAMIGVVVVDNASGSNFVGGTTALDAASVTSTFYSVVGPAGFAPAAVAAIPTK